MLVGLVQRLTGRAGVRDGEGGEVDGVPDGHHGSARPHHSMGSLGRRRHACDAYPHCLHWIRGRRERVLGEWGKGGGVTLG